MQIYRYPAPDSWNELLARPLLDQSNLESRVRPILTAVKDQGDAALRRFTAAFDRVELEELRVPAAALAAAEKELPAELKSAIQLAQANIEAFHAAQQQPVLEVETMPGVRCWRKSVPIQRVGLYIPGGTAPLFSTILMLAVPARLAGCQQIVLCTPPGPEGEVHPAIRYTAHLTGISDIFCVGGAQAIAAMAFGTESIPQVDKIFGPGNQYVTMAKQLVNANGTAIDMPAGPSEVAVMADATVPAAFIAADLLSQAEHGADSQVLLVSTEESVLEAVELEVTSQLASLPRAEIARQALDNSRSILLSDWDTGVKLINQYAPEHLIIATAAHEQLAERITQAGSVFLGAYTPESVGDYASGTNHTLPTNGFARAYSGVSLDSFVKKITFQKLSPAGLKRIGPAVELMALAEALTAHQQAVAIRLAHLDQTT